MLSNTGNCMFAAFLCGGSYAVIPLEINACELEARYEMIRGANFSGDCFTSDGRTED